MYTWTFFHRLTYTIAHFFKDMHIIGTHVSFGSMFHGLVKVMNAIAEWWCTFQCTHVLHTMPVEKNICLSVKWCQKCAQKEQPKMTKYCFLCTCTRTNLRTCFNYWRLSKKWQKNLFTKICDMYLLRYSTKSGQNAPSKLCK
jgi:hypothetical protein